MNLLTIANAKTIKGESAGYLTGILYLNPEGLCPWSTVGCRAACLYTSGRGAFWNVQEARTRKAQLWRKDKDHFIALLREDIATIIRSAKRVGLKPAIRLNGTSDILWERHTPHLFRVFPEVQFYDYTKAPYRLRPIHLLPKNYHLTYSASEESTIEDIESELANGRNVAIVSESLTPLNEFFAIDYIDGDKHDLRFLDDSPRIIRLSPKGKARKDETGFVFDKQKQA